MPGIFEPWQPWPERVFIILAQDEEDEEPKENEELKEEVL